MFIISTSLVLTCISIVQCELFYIFGGERLVNGRFGNQEKIVSNQVNIYNFSTNEWYNGADMPKKRVGSIAVNLGKKMVLIGGRYTDGEPGLVEVYNIKTNRWKKWRNMPTERRNFGAAVRNNEIFVCGGYDGRTIYTSTNKCVSYKPSVKKWNYIEPMNHIRLDSPMVECNGDVYSIGGMVKTLKKGGELQPSATMERYRNGKWEMVAPLPSGNRVSHGAYSAGGSIYVIGGKRKFEFYWNKNLPVEIYNCTAGTWKTMGDSSKKAGTGFGLMPSKFHEKVDGVYPPTIMYYGGAERDTMPKCEVWEYIPPTDTWFKTPTSKYGMPECKTKFAYGFLDTPRV